VNRIKAIARRIDSESSEDRVSRWTLDLIELAESLLQDNLGIDTGNPPVEKPPLTWSAAIDEIKDIAGRIEKNDPQQKENSDSIKQLAEQARQIIFGPSPGPK